VEFQVGDKVVYPSQGVTVIESIGEENLGGVNIECYNLRMLSTDSKLMVPLRNAERIGLRSLSDPDQVSESMGRLKANEVSGSSDWKDRYKSNLERLKTGDLDEVVDVIICLAEVSRRKSLSFRERKMFDQAQQILAYEVAEVAGRKFQDVAEEITAIIESCVDQTDTNESESGE